MTARSVSFASLSAKFGEPAFKKQRTSSQPASYASSLQRAKTLVLERKGSHAKPHAVIDDIVIISITFLPLKEVLCSTILTCKNWKHLSNVALSVFLNEFSSHTLFKHVDPLNIPESVPEDFFSKEFRRRADLIASTFSSYKVKELGGIFSLGMREVMDRSVLQFPLTNDLTQAFDVNFFPHPFLGTPEMVRPHFGTPFIAGTFLPLENDFDPNMPQPSQIFHPQRFIPKRTDLPLGYSISCISSDGFIGTKLYFVNHYCKKSISRYEITSFCFLPSNRFNTGTNNFWKMLSFACLSFQENIWRCEFTSAQQ